MNNEQQKKTSESGDTAMQQQNGLVDQAKHVAAVVADKVGEQVSHGIEEKRDAAVQKIGGVAEAVRWGSKMLKDVGPLGQVSEKAADGIEDVASFFDNKQVGDLVRDVERFARREPAIFLGAAFAIGLIGGRFLKSSGHRSSANFGDGRMRAGYGRRDERYDDIDGSYDDYDIETYAAPPSTQRTGSTQATMRTTQPTPVRTQPATGSIKPTPIVNASSPATSSSTKATTHTTTTSGSKPRNNGSAGS
jgi:hypothetical protein